MTDWVNAIVDIGEEDPEQLLANPRNWRVHPKQQQDALGEILDRVGWVKPVIVNRQTGHVVDGHLRVMLAISKHEGAVPVSYVDLTEDQERLVLATIDPIADLAIVDEDALVNLVASISNDINGEIRTMMEGFVNLDDLASELGPDPLRDLQDSILPASGHLSDPSPSPNGSEASDRPETTGDRMLGVTCPHCAHDYEVNLTELREQAAA